ncbi:hypothetical protein GY45DRAFT_1262887 [Cubamyces sp. BRFM 1775]|nr:hypothetical protein GY45DRAFT_1262887 [Cubamyces sp. BRFM 1775]
MAGGVIDASTAHDAQEDTSADLPVVLDAADKSTRTLTPPSQSEGEGFSPSQVSWKPTAGPSSASRRSVTPASARSSQGASETLEATQKLDDVPVDDVQPLASYTCPICFSPPTYATITPCGHVLCGDCLFTAVKTTIQRGAYTLPASERMIARCPVCRAQIPGWDGRGGGVIGLRPRAVFSL